MQLAEQIQYIYPDIDFISGVKLQDDGAGPYIAEWLDASLQPTSEELLATVLPRVQELKLLELKTACTNYIQSGFTSSTLGSPHTYDSALPQDQINLVGAKMVGIDMYFTCTDAQGYKGQKLHTVAQIGQIYLAGMLHIQTAKGRFYARKTLVESAVSAEEVALVSW